MKHAEARQEFCYSLSDELRRDSYTTSIQTWVQVNYWGHPYSWEWIGSQRAGHNEWSIDHMNYDITEIFFEVFISNWKFGGHRTSYFGCYWYYWINLSFPVKFYDPSNTSRREIWVRSFKYRKLILSHVHHQPSGSRWVHLIPCTQTLLNINNHGRGRVQSNRTIWNN